jgi:hypothetical protein
MSEPWLTNECCGIQLDRILSEYLEEQRVLSPRTGWPPWPGRGGQREDAEDASSTVLDGVRRALPEERQME